MLSELALLNTLPQRLQSRSALCGDACCRFPFLALPEAALPPSSASLGTLSAPSPRSKQRRKRRLQTSGEVKAPAAQNHRGLAESGRGLSAASAALPAEKAGLARGGPGREGPLLPPTRPCWREAPRLGAAFPWQPPSEALPGQRGRDRRGFVTIVKGTPEYVI